jgi:hypothetical protein
LVPAAWRETTVIPILMSGKDRFLITSYRHASLTSCVCTTLECMINHHLVWILESRSLLLNAQYSFWFFRYALEHLVNLEHCIQYCCLMCNILSKCSSAWRWFATWHANVISKGPFTSRILGVGCHCSSQVFPKFIIPVIVFAMFFPAFCQERHRKSYKARLAVIVTLIALTISKITQ